MGADENGLDNTSGGLCSTHSMKLKLFVHPGGKTCLEAISSTSRMFRGHFDLFIDQS